MRINPISPRSLRGWTVLLIALTLGGQAARGEEEEPPAYTAEEVMVTGRAIPSSSSIATKLSVPLLSIPASVGVVTNDLVESQAGTVLGDALENVSGVNVQTGFGVHDFFSIRGFDSLSNGLVLTDGAAEPEVSFYNLYNVEQVEVLKGPGAFLYGGNPLSGTVNLVRVQPVLRNFAHVTGAYGRFQSYRTTVDLGLADLDRGLAFRLNALYQAADNYREDKDNSGFGINPALKWHLNPSSALQVNFEYSNSEYKADSGLPILGANSGVPMLDNGLPDVPRQRSYQSPFDVSDQDTYRVRVDFHTRLNSALEVRDKFYYTDFKWVSRGTLITGPGRDQLGASVPGQLGRSLTLLDDRQKLVGNQLEVLLDFATGRVRHALLVGFELSRLEDEYTLNVAFLPNMDVLAPVEFAAEPLFLIPGQHREGDTRSRTLAPYFVNRIFFAEQYQVFAGGRFDAINYEDKPNQVGQTFNKLSPMLGVVYAPVSDLSFYGNAGRAFAPPSTLGRGERKAEESTQLEAGARKHLFSGRLKAGLALYQLSKDVASDDGATRRTGEQRSRGVEVEVAAQPAPNWQVFASYGYSVAALKDYEELFRLPTPAGGFFEQVFDRSGKKPDFAPEHLLNVWTTWQVWKGVGAGFGARYVDSQFIAPDNAFKIDEVLKFDASLYFFTGPRRLRVNFENLTNHEYETRGFGSTSVIPADPLSVHGTMEWMF